MINYRWIPPKTIVNWEGPDATDIWTFNAGALSPSGVAYSQVDPQQTLTAFATAVSTTPGGNVEYGNDCSGFVSMAWNLPTRYDTRMFEADAISPGDYVTSRGANGSAKDTILLSGDALVDDGNHMVLFKERALSGTVMTMEQTPHGAQTKTWSWEALSPNYRPIRRNNMDETVYTGSLLATGDMAQQPNGSYYYSGTGGIHSGRLGGPNTAADFDLYLYKWNGTGWHIVASSVASFSSEAVDYSDTVGGYYTWVVSSWSGSGSYELSIKKP